jgi:lantibiotic biosynthesis protein
MIEDFCEACARTTYREINIGGEKLATEQIVSPTSLQKDIESGSTAVRTWHPPTLTTADRARASALEVVRRLQRNPTELTNEHYDPSLAGGDAGLAVLFGYLDRIFPAEGWDKIAHQAVLRISASIGTEQSVGLFGGLSGLAFATWYLSRSDSRYRRARLAIEEVLLPRAVILAESLTSRYGIPVEDYDVVTGISGVAAYLLCRIKDNSALQTLQTIVAALVEIAERDTPVPAWFTPGDMISSRGMVGKYPEGCLNCGLAHGMPGMLSVLALAYRQDIEVKGSRSAIERLAHWLIAQSQTDRWGTLWPAAVGVRASDLPTSGPLGWCYGNPGVARALWLAGSALGNVALCDTAMEVLRSVYRRPPSRRGLTSPTFCHGAAGLLQITMRFASDTTLPEFSDAASCTLEKLLMLFVDDSSFGYRDHDHESGLVDRAGLLEGAAGVALVLLAATSDQDPDWDRIFLIS